MFGTTGLVATVLIFAAALALAIAYLFRPRRALFTAALTGGAGAVICGALSLPGGPALTLSSAVLIIVGILGLRLTALAPAGKELQ